MYSVQWGDSDIHTEGFDGSATHGTFDSMASLVKKKPSFYGCLWIYTLRNKLDIDDTSTKMCIKS